MKLLNVLEKTKVAILEKKKAKQSYQEKLAKRFGITKFAGHGTGVNEDKGIWYGWSHRAVCGFKIGDKIFETNFGNSATPFTKHGSKPIKTLKDAKVAATRFAKYVS